jgi:hypothetical protein
MTLSRIARRIGMFFLFFSLPLQAQLRHHALTPLGEVTISGVVREASTGAPVAGAVVHSGTSFCMQGGTKADGKYTLTIPGGRTSLISAEHFAYDTQTVNVEMKSGEKTAAYFNDSCYGYEVDFFGRERSTGTFLYDHFKDITEIDFP